MTTIQRIDRLPANFSQFVDEIAASYERLFGYEAMCQYRQQIMLLDKIVQHPSIDVIAASDQAQVVGLACITHKYIGDLYMGSVAFFHVLTPWITSDVPRRLLEACLDSLDNDAVDAVVQDSISLCEVDLRAVYEAHGYTIIPREYMASPLHTPLLQRHHPGSMPICTEVELEEAALVLVDTYRQHPEYLLHMEAHSQGNAESFLQDIMRGQYGTVQAEFFRCIRDEGRMIAWIAGSELYVGTGFVLHVVVTPSYQGQGLGRRLMQDLAEAFRQQHMSTMALTVTTANPARRLYQSLGFTTRCAYEASLYYQPV